MQESSRAENFGKTPTRKQIDITKDRRQMIYIKAQTGMMKMMNSLKAGILLLCIFTIQFTATRGLANGIPAFPGAEGFGSKTPGGRGGKILEVTNLNDSGPGSFRQAVEVEVGPRVVIFKTGGRIHLENSVIIRNPFLTIAGQTAPGGGICISNAPLIVGTHDVVVRGLRVRPGDDPTGFNPDKRDGIAISSSYTNQEVYNVVIDHCSLSWAVGKNLSIWEMLDRPSVHDITIQWCVVSEALYDSLHSRGPQGNGMVVGYNQNISIHHNLFAHNHKQNPRISGSSETEIINNIVYNWRDTSFHYTHNNQGPHGSTAMNNQFIPGPATYTISDGSGRYRKGILMDKLASGTQVFLWGNMGPGREAHDQPEWDAATSKWVGYSNVPIQYRSAVAPSNLSGVTADPIEDNFSLILDNVGAIWPRRDSVDERIIKDVVNGTAARGQGGIIDSQRDVGGWPIYRPGNAAVDSDKDGIPDSWETLYGFDPNNPFDATGDADGDRYANIEEYLNGTHPDIPENSVLPNAPPAVNAGTNQTIVFPNAAFLLGRVNDDNRPNPPNKVTTVWTQVSGRGTVSFGDFRSAETTATFSEAGTYILRLTASDGELSRADEITVVCVDNGSTGIPAFPGAEGFGSKTPGGRGGSILEVTNLNDSGPGSFREAVEIASGPRIVVFRTGGRVHLKKSIVIQNPFITIAGQSAPGDGFCLSNAPLVVGTHDVIVRGLRIRPGDDPSGPDRATRDGITISSSFTNQEVYNVVIDHCSISWGIDENISTWQASGKPAVHDISVQWCITSEALNDSLHPKGPHSMGMLIGPNKNISVHHTLFAHNDRRNPRIVGSSTTELINNVVYNWRNVPFHYHHGGEGKHLSSLINNRFIPGPATKTVSDGTERHRRGIFFEKLSDGSQAYLWGNIGPGREIDNQPQWDAATSKWVSYGDVPIKYRAASPASEGSNTTVDGVSSNLKVVLNNAGAIWPRRDSVDKRVINDVIKGTGANGQNGIIDSQDDVGGWPTYRSGTAEVDSDKDGMPDSWESLFSLNPNDPSDSINDPDDDVYTNVEEFLNSTNPRVSEGDFRGIDQIVVLQGKDLPEVATTTLLVDKPTDASSSAMLTLMVFDADSTHEGELIINGHGPITLFGNRAKYANDRTSVPIALTTPATWWNNGLNSLRFAHTSGGGYRVESASVEFDTTTDFPIALQGKHLPEEANVSLMVTKPSGTGSTAALTMTVFDADNATEGELTINGYGPITLFGNRAKYTNDGRTVSVTMTTPADWWNDGPNTLRFVHTSSGGYRVENASVVFETLSSFPVALQGKNLPEEAKVNLVITKPNTSNSIAKLTMKVFDADNATEGELTINGHGPITLFGNLAKTTNDRRTASINLATPAGWWNNGPNTLRFVHTSTGGYRVESATVTFENIDDPAM